MEGRNSGSCTLVFLFSEAASEEPFPRLSGFSMGLVRQPREETPLEEQRRSKCTYKSVH